MALFNFLLPKKNRNEKRGVLQNDPNVIYGSLKDNKIINQLKQNAYKRMAFNMSQISQLAVIYTCSTIRGDYFARTPIDIIQTKNGIPKILKDDPRYDVLHFDPNPYQTHFALFKSIEYNRPLDGNSFVRINRLGNKKISLERISNKFIDYVIEDGRKYYKFIDDNNKEEIIDGVDLLHFQNTTTDDQKGTSVIKAIEDVLDINLEGWKTIRNLFRRGLKTTYALKWPMVVPDQDAQEEAVQEFEDKYMTTDPEVEHGLARLPRGSDLIRTSVTPENAEFNATIKLTIEQICAAFRVPAHMVNILEQTKWNSVTEMQRAFLHDSFGSDLKMYRDELESKLLSLDERKAGMTIKFNTNSILETDLATRADVYKKQIGLWLTVNDVREKEGLPPVENGDKLWMPANMLFLQDRTTNTSEKEK